jgi:hypothetical protein
LSYDTVTMVTGLDDLDLECLGRRLDTALQRLAAVKAPAVVSSDFRGVHVAVESLKVHQKDDRLTLVVGGVGTMWGLSLDMPMPAWWNPAQETVATDIGTLLSTWSGLIGSPRARLSGRIDVAGTGLSRLRTELGAVMLSDGLDPKDAVDVVVRARLPYEPASPRPGQVPMVRADTTSRTVGVQKQRMLSTECEDALLSRHAAFQLEITGARRFSIDAAPPVSTTADATDPMDVLRILDALGLKAGGRHVLKAARRPVGRP